MYATALLVSLRYVIYGALLAPHFEHLPAWWRALLSAIVVDAIFALFIGRYQPNDRDPCKHWFFLGASVAMYGVWQTSTWLGVFAGAAIPGKWSLEFAATLGLIATLIPLLLDRAVVAAALAGGAASLILLQAPLKLGLLVSVAAGVIAGLLASWLMSRRVRG
jgi:predicted branched-subunit amino acid permease